MIASRQLRFRSVAWVKRYVVDLGSELRYRHYETSLKGEEKEHEESFPDVAR